MVQPVRNGDHVIRTLALCNPILTQVRQHPASLNNDAFSNILGVAAPYDTPTEHGGHIELVDRNAFRGVLGDSKKDVRLYTDHRYSVDSLLASRKSGTLKVGDSNDGLTYEAKIPNTERSRHLIGLAEQGALGASIGFAEATSTFEMRDGVRHWTDIDLREISIVTQPAYQQTTVESREQGAIDDWITVFTARRQQTARL